MRKNPRYTLLTITLAVCLPAAVSAKPPPETVAVDCTHKNPRKQDSITAALANPAEELIIEISGMCQQRVVITRHNVTLIGSDPATDGITGPALDDPFVQRSLVRVNDGRNVRLENLTITGSEDRGLEGRGVFSTVEVVNCRISGNAGTGAQFGGSATFEDTVVSDNGGRGLTVVGYLGCTRCTVDGDDGLVALAGLGGRMDFVNSSLSTSAGIAIISAWNSYIDGYDTDVTAGGASLYASENSQITWSGGEVSGSIWADTASQVFLNGVTQTTNPWGNSADHDSHFMIKGGTFLGDTRMTGFSSATAENGATFDTITCDRGGDFFCDGVTKNSSSGCGLCL